MKAQTILRISTVLSESILLMKYEKIRKKTNFFLLGVGREVGVGVHRCNINFSNGQSIGIVLYGMCSRSLYIKGQN